jgi:glycosyltransferase involved in cell wall biosynthesis
VINGNKISPFEMGELLASFDIAVFPSHGEGFGLGGLQAMGTGTTCICTDWGGFKEYLNPEYNFALDYTLVEIKNVASNNTFYSGQWAQASYEHLRKLLRYTYEHRDEIHEKGKKAAQWVKDYWTWKRCGQQLIDAIDEYEGIV